MIRIAVHSFMRKTLLFAGVIMLGFSSCQSGEEQIKEIDWLLGTWEGLDDNELLFVEVWEKGIGDSYTGKGATITPDGDTLFKETLKIELVEGVPYYVATVPENPGPVLFKLVEGDETHCVFENLDHDFPQRISYTLETKSTMSVKLEGIEEGVPRSESLNFEKNTGVSLLPGVNSDSLIWELLSDTGTADSTGDTISSVPNQVQVEQK